MVRKKKSIPIQAEEAKKYRVTYMLPGVNIEMSFDTEDINKETVEQRFSRLFKGLKLINVEEIK